MYIDIAIYVYIVIPSKMYRHLGTSKIDSHTLIYEEDFIGFIFIHHALRCNNCRHAKKPRTKQL